MATALPLRKEVPVEHTWDVHSIFPSDQDWEAAVRSLTARLPELAAFRGRLGEGPAVIADCIELVEELAETVGKIYMYGVLRFTVDTSDQAAAALHDRARGVFAQFMATMSFLEPELLAVGPERLLQWAEEEPRLAICKHYFDMLARQKEHVRSAEVEELLSLVQDPFRTAAGIHGVISDADIRFRPAKDSQGNEHEVAQGTINALLHSPDRELRRTAWESYADGYLALKNGLANCMAAGVKQNVFMARARRYKSAGVDRRRHEQVAGRSFPGGLRRRGRGGHRPGRHYVGAVPDASVLQLLRLPVRHRDFRRPRAGQQVLSGEPGAAEAYLSFLKAGSSMYPLDALRMAGVDLSTPQPVEETFGVLAQLVDRLERLIAARAS